MMQTSLGVQKTSDFSVSISDNTIVPEEYQNLLIYWRDQFTKGFFVIGDIANNLITESIKSGLRVNDQRIFDAVGKYCGRSGRTVRYYAETASFFPQEIRDEYDELPFAYFVFAKSYGDWKSVLDYAMENPAISVDALRDVFLSKLAKQRSEEMREVSPISGSLDGVDLDSADLDVDSDEINAGNFTQDQSKMREVSHDNAELQTLLWEISDLVYRLRSFEGKLPGLDKSLLPDQDSELIVEKIKYVLGYAQSMSSIVVNML